MVDDGGGANDEIFVGLVDVVVGDGGKKSHGLVSFAKTHVVAEKS